MINLVKPSREYINTISEYRKAFKINGEKITGGCSLDKYSDITEWIKLTQDMESEKSEEQGLVPSVTYICIREEDKKMIGILSIRKYLTDSLLTNGGHIGYSVHPEERSKGYGSNMLKEALKECKKMNISKVLVVCKKNNKASERVIVKNGGKLANIINGTKRFWIDMIQC